MVWRSALQRKSHFCIPFLGIVRPQFQFPHSRVCVRFKYSQDRSTLGLATEFRSEKIPRNRLGMDSVIPRKKMLISRAFRGLRKSLFPEARNGTELRRKKISFTKQPKSLNKNIFPYFKEEFFDNI